MKPLLSVSLWLALSVLVCCENSEKDDWDNYDLTEFNWLDYSDFNFLDYNIVMTTDLVHTTLDEAESNFRNKASGIGQLKLVFLLGLAILQIWN